MKLIKHIVILLILLTSSISFAQVKFEAKVSKDIVNINETIIVDFKINTEEDEDTFTPPNFKGFTILNRDNINSDRTLAKGQSEFKKTYKLFISPKKEGAFVIDEATIKVDGKFYKTDPIKVKVVANDSIRENEYLDKKFSEYIHLETTVSKNRITLEESIIVSYKLYVSPNSGISSWELLKMPTFENFDIKEIEIKNINVENGSFKGENYRYVIFKTIELKPKKKGELKIDPLILNVVAEIPTDKFNVYGGRIFKPVTKTLETKPVIVIIN